MHDTDVEARGVQGQHAQWQARASPEGRLELKSLAEDALRLRDAGISASHRRMVDGRAREWRQFCATMAAEGGEPTNPLDAPEAVWGLFIAHLARRGLAARTVNAYLSAVRTWHALNGVSPPHDSGFLRLAVRGVARDPLAPPQRAQRQPRTPLTVAVLAHIRCTFDMRRLSDAALWLACLLGVKGLLRAGEFTVTGDLPRAHVEQRLLRVRHASLVLLGVGGSESPGLLTLHIPVTKTSQLRGTDVHYTRETAAGHAINCHRPIAMRDDGIIIALIS